MRYEAFYVIRPAAALKEYLQQADPDVATFLSRPLLWTKKEGGVTAWTDEEYLAQSKLLFLLNLWSDYVIGAGEDESLKTALEEILDAPPFNESLFDRWWSIERFDGVDESFEEAEDRLCVEQPHLLASSTLPRVEAWLSQLEKRVTV
jgi:hypothetical protein